MHKFLQDVLAGLSAGQKRLNSKYFYDQTGDRIFEEIMNMPEYYLTGCELEILTRQKEQICSDLGKGGTCWDVAELGPGNAYKSRHILSHLQDKAWLNTYFPVDISEGVIRHLQLALPEQIPGIRIQGLAGDYFQMIPGVEKASTAPLFVLFLGGNIGNFETDEMEHVLRQLFNLLRPGDHVLMGFDLKKRPAVIRAAYNDASGITARFNLNLLERINRELNGNFIIDHFEHYCSYEPMSGACRSFLVSLRKQAVQIGEQEFLFERDECIRMEISQKYDVLEIEHYTTEAGFIAKAFYFDEKRWFTNVLLQVPGA